MKKKIDFVFGNLYSFGGEQAINALLANLIVDDYDVRLVSIFKTGAHPCYLTDARIKLENIFTRKFSFKAHLFRFLCGIRSYVANTDADIIVFSSPAYSLFAEWFVKLGVKTVYWHHQAFTFGRKFGLEWLGSRAAAKFGNAVVCLTRRAQGDYRSHFGKAGRFEQIYNACFFEPLTSAYDVASKKIMSCGRLSYQKGFDLLVPVAAKVFKRYPDWQWHIYGDGPDRLKLEQMTQQAGLQNHLIWKGSSSWDELIKAYPKYALFVLTSRHEGFPMALLEAQCAKMPIVSFNCPSGPDEIVTQGKDGFLIDCFDLDAMAERICMLIEHPEMRKEFSDYASISCNRFGREKFANQWRNLFETL